MAQQFEKDEKCKTHIESLPIEILTHVFSYLTKFERLYMIPAVCQRWQSVTEMDFRCNSVAFITPDLYFPSNYPSCKIFEDPYECKQIIRMVGWGLHTIIFDEGYQAPDNMFELIGQHCPQLRYLETPRNMSSKDIATLSKNCFQLERLVMRNIPRNCDAEMSMLFKANPKLSNVTFALCDFIINRNCLSFLTEDSRQFDLIKFVHCTINRTHLEVFEKLQVREIVFHDTPANTTYISPGDKSLVKCAGEMGDYLHHFSMSCEYWSPFLWPLKHFAAICELTELISLHIEHNSWLCNRHIAIITENCRKLRAVKLVSSPRVDDTGLGHVLRLPELRVLCFENCESNYMYNFNSGVPALLPKLMQLRLSNITVSENGLLNLVKSAPRLRLLELVACIGINSTIAEKTKLARIDSRYVNDDLLTLCVPTKRNNLKALRNFLDSHLDQIRKFLKEILDDMFSDIEKNKRPFFPDFLSTFYTIDKYDLEGIKIEHYFFNLLIFDLNDLKPID